MIYLKYFVLYLLMLLGTTSVLGFVDPLTAIGVIGAGIGIWNFNSITNYFYCQNNECCIDRDIPFNTTRLDQLLDSNLYGQHIVKTIVTRAIRAQYQYRSKPLVLNFHGTPGTGKNYVADMIAESLYSRGSSSKFVHKFMGRADFPRSDHINNYIQRIDTIVRNAVKECPRSLFIFDEVDKMPQGIFDALTSLLNYNTISNGMDLSKSIFIFLSNTAGVQISEQLGKLMSEGTLREDTKLGDFEQILSKAAYNLEGGFQKSRMIETHVIDHFIPFLPLEKSHLYKCVAYQWERFEGFNRIPLTISEMDEIIDPVVMYDPTYGIFAKSGCKKLDHKVHVYAYEKRRS